MNANLFALFRSRFPENRAAPFIETPDGAQLSYAELDTESARIAGLLKELGVATGDRVVVQVDKSPEAILLYLACLRAGAVYVPLNVAYTAAEVAYFVDDAAPKVLVCRPEAQAELQADALRAGVAHVLTLDSARGGTLMERRSAAPDAAIAEVEKNHPAAILYTSGTTGRSKGAILTHHNLASNALALVRIWRFEARDVLLHALPIFHVHGLFVATHCVLMSGARMIFLPRFDAGQVVALLPRATVLMGVPTFYVRLLERPELTRERCASMRLFISGSAPLLDETFRAFEARTGHRILERYGMSEALMITSNPLDGERIPGTVGYALPEVEVRIADENGRLLEPGEVGALEMRGPNVFKGYWRMPDKTRAEFRDDGFFISGDLARIAPDGRVSLVGRAKDLIISGGYNVYPKEIELQLDALPGVKESAVVGLPHADFGEAVAAVVTRDGTADVSEESIIATLKGRLANFKLPKRVFFVDALPRNVMGKVQKNELRDRYAATFRA